MAPPLQKRLQTPFPPPIPLTYSDKPVLWEKELQRSNLVSGDGAMKNLYKSLVLTGLVCLSGSVAARPPGSDDDRATAPASETRVVHNHEYINANNILIFVTNHGNFARDLSGVFGRDAGTFFPYVSNEAILDGTLNNYVLYAGGLWIGGTVNGQIRVTIAEYSDEYIPGPMNQIASINGNDTVWTFNPGYDTDPNFKMYRIHSDSLADNPNSDYSNWPVHHGAPVYPDDGRPFWMGEQTLWSVFNEANPQQHSNDAGETNPLGIEVQMTVWADDSQDGLVDTTVLTGPVDVTHVGSGFGTVEVYVADPIDMTTDDYMVVFEEHPVLGLVWHVVNATTGVTVLSDQTNQTGGGEYPTVDGLLIRVIAPPVSGVAAIDEMANGSGPVIPPDNVMYSLNSTGDWYISSDNGANFARMNWRGHIGFSDWEFRFTAGGSNYYDWWMETLQSDRAPFEVWNIGVKTPDDQSDDVRINFAFIDDDQSGGWSWGDRIYPYEHPYEEPAPSIMEYLWDDDFHIGRIVFNDYSESFGQPAEGTIVRFTTWMDNHNTPADTFFFAQPDYNIVETFSDGNAIFIEYKLYNKGGNTIENCYISMWNDPDLGEYTNDYVGCDTLSDIFYCYNGTDWDNQFGARVPAVGYKLLDGPLVESPNDTAYFDGYLRPGYRNLGMTSFAKYINGTDPNDFNETYRYMQGLRNDGSPYTNPDGVETKFMLAGDPVTGTGDIDFDPSDRRFMASSGPFTFAPGDSQFVRYKLAVGQGTNRLESITKMKAILNTPRCCRLRGDINHKDSPQLDISDLTYFVDYMFTEGPSPICMEEADVNGDGEEMVDIADLVYLIDYSFRGGPPPPRCR